MTVSQNSEKLKNDKTSQRYILIILILTILLGGGTLAYLKFLEGEIWMPQIRLPGKFISETANWEIYRNEEYGFEFKYPQEWHLNFEEPNVEVASVPKNEYVHGLGIPEYGNVWLVIIKNDKKGPDGENIIDVYKDIKIVELKKIAAEKDLIYEIILSFYQGDVRENNYRAIFNQILSNFKFIE